MISDIRYFRCTLYLAEMLILWCNATLDGQMTVRQGFPPGFTPDVCSILSPVHRTLQQGNHPRPVVTLGEGGKHPPLREPVEMCARIRRLRHDHRDDHLECLDRGHRAEDVLLIQHLVWALGPFTSRTTNLLLHSSPFILSTHFKV